MKAVATEAGMIAVRRDAARIVHADLQDAVREVAGMDRARYMD